MPEGERLRRHLSSALEHVPLLPELGEPEEELGKRNALRNRAGELGERSGSVESLCNEREHPPRDDDVICFVDQDDVGIVDYLYVIRGVPLGLL